MTDRPEIKASTACRYVALYRNKMGETIAIEMGSEETEERQISEPLWVEFTLLPRESAE